MSLLWKTATNAADAWNNEPPYEGPYFHGTIRSLEPGDVISPADQRPQHPVTFRSETDHSYAYATSEDNAWDYAEKAHNVHFRPGSNIHPRNYEVRPLGPVEKDPVWSDGPNGRGGHGYHRGNWDTDVRSKHGFEVVREVPMPEHMGEPEDWR